MKKINIIIVCSFFLFIFTTLFFSLENEKIYNTENIIGKKINEVELNLFNNSGIFNTKEISKYNYALLNFWASWCGPCRIEHKYLLKLSKLKNLKIIGINFKDDKINAKKFLNELGNPFFVLTTDIEGKKSVNFGVYGIPETFLVNKDLIILKKYIGPLDQKDVNEIKKIINK
tara:strand:+ start:679 stop:1197 length:519 start_codon:yes stop_codon:yes gene_type:complete